jgi:hypothetical protein
MKRPLVGLALGCSLLVACAARPSPQSPPPSSLPRGAGLASCQRLADESQRDTQLFMGTGVTATVLGGVGVASGLAMGPDRGTEASWVERNRNVLVGAGGVILSGVGVFLLLRAAEAGRTSGEALRLVAAASGPRPEVSDIDAYRGCLDARAVWKGSWPSLELELAKARTEVASARERQERVSRASSLAVAEAQLLHRGAVVRQLEERLEHQERERRALVKSVQRLDRRDAAPPAPTLPARPGKPAPPPPPAPPPSESTGELVEQLAELSRRVERTRLELELARAELEAAKRREAEALGDSRRNLGPPVGPRGPRGGPPPEGRPVPPGL